MRTFLTASLLALPAAAQAMGMHGSYGCGSGHAGLAAGAVYAVVAVLGYWVLLQAVQSSSACIKRIGDVLGSILVIVGLLGLLCAVYGHVKSSMCGCCGGPGPGPGLMAPGGPQMGDMPAGHPMVPGMSPPAPETKKGGKAK